MLLLELSLNHFECENLTFFPGSEVDHSAGEGEGFEHGDILPSSKADFHIDFHAASCLLQYVVSDAARAKPRPAHSKLKPKQHLVVQRVLCAGAKSDEAKEVITCVCPMFHVPRITFVLLHVKGLRSSRIRVVSSNVPQEEKEDSLNEKVRY